MRLFALGAGLAGLVALISQASMTAITMFKPDLADYVPTIIQVARWAQTAFVLLISAFLVVFGLSKRSG